MPKLIIPKRTDKSVSVDDYWKIRSNYSQAKSKPTVASYRTQQVQRRYRYSKPTVQALTFNPLFYFLTNKQFLEPNLQGTHTQKYLQQIKYRVPQQLIPIKKMMLGLVVMLNNLDKIYEELWEHRNSQDSWMLMQMLLRDTKTQSYRLWLNKGLAMILQDVDNGFNIVKFRRIFNTFCIFMQNCFSAITESTDSLKEYFTTIAQLFFQNKNKYIRKFSIKASSYIISNLEQETFHAFLQHIIKSRQLFQFISSFLAQRLKYSQGCLTPNSLQQLINLLNWLSGSSEMVDQQQQDGRQQLPQQVMTAFIAKVLENLEDTGLKKQRQQSENLFDITYVIKALIQLSNKSGKIPAKCILLAIDSHSNQEEQHKSKRRKRPIICQTTKKIAFEFLWDQLPSMKDHLQAEQILQVYRMLAQSLLLCEISSVNNVTDFLSEQQDCNNIAYFLECLLGTNIDAMVQRIEELSHNTSQILIYALSKQIRHFLNIIHDHDLQSDKLTVLLVIVHKIWLICQQKQLKITKLQTVIPTQISAKKYLHTICCKIVSISKQSSPKTMPTILLFLRLLSIIKYQQLVQPSCSTKLQDLHISIQQKWSHKIIEIYAKKKQYTCQTNWNIFVCENYVDEIITRDCNKVGWLGWYLAVIDSFRKISEDYKIKGSAITHPIIERLKLRRQDGHDLEKYQEILGRCQIKGIDDMGFLLQSRNRVNRLLALKAIKSRLDKQQWPANVGFMISIIETLIQIDEDLIDLETQRDVKRLFAKLTQQIATNTGDNTKQIHEKLLVSWSIGFAYTGFRLVTECFVEYLKTILEWISQKSDNSSQSLHIILHHLQYQTLKNSRIFHKKLTQFLQEFNTKQVQDEDQVLEQLMININLNSLEDNMITQSLGVQRIAQSIQTSQKIKKACGARLVNLMQQYFAQQFYRSANTIRQLTTKQQQQQQQQTNISDKKQAYKTQLLPCRIKFTEQTILRICPSSFQPPMDCLNYTKIPYLRLTSVTKIKKQDWQSNWLKANAKNGGKKQQENRQNITVDFEKMSPQQKQMYVHFLYGEILQANTSTLRTIVDYIRDYMPDMVDYFIRQFIDIQVLLSIVNLVSMSHSLSADRKPEIFSDNNAKIIKKILLYTDSRKLLTYIYILKAIVKSLGYYLREQDHVIEVILYLVVLLLEIVQVSHTKQQIVQEGQGEKQEEEQMQEQMQDEQIEEKQISGGKKNGLKSQYRNHRKQSYKLLTLIVHQLNDAISPEQITNVLDIFNKQNKITNLAASAQHSAPGILLFLKQVCTIPYYHQPVINICNGGFIAQIGNIFQKCSLQSPSAIQPSKPINRQSITSCIDILNNILSIPTTRTQQQQKSQLQQQHNHNNLIPFIPHLLQSILKYLTSSSSVTETSSSKTTNYHAQFSINPLLKICYQLTSIASIASKQEKHKCGKVMGEQWEAYLLKEVNRLLARNRALSEANSEKLQCVLNIAMNYVYFQQCDSKGMEEEKSGDKQFLLKLVYLLPIISNITHRKIIIDSVSKHASSNNFVICDQIARIAVELTSIVPNSLQNQLDFVRFFAAINMIDSTVFTASIIEQEYILYCLLAYLSHQQYSVRKSISTVLQKFLEHGNKSEEKIKVIRKLYRYVVEYLRKPNTTNNQTIFWGVLTVVAHFCRWAYFSDAQNSHAEGYHILEGLVQANIEENTDIFELLCGLSQNKKMQGLKKLKVCLAKYSNDLQILNQPGNKYPNIISTLFMPILEHIILPPSLVASNSRQQQWQTVSNLSSTLSHIALEVYELVVKMGGLSLQKKQLKRHVAKIRLTTGNMSLGTNQSQASKKNIQLIKLISRIIQSINLPDCTNQIANVIKQSGFDQLHRKIVQKQSKFIRLKEESESEQSQQEGIKKKAFDGINREVNDQQFIDMNYLAFDRKLMHIEQQEEAGLDQQLEKSNQKQIVKFLKTNILTPLKTLLMFENRSSKNNQQENEKGRMYLSVVVTKIILKFPLDTFIVELQKVVSKLCRLLKKRKLEVRENARKCLTQISKLIGPQLLYVIIRQLKFHLRDNFQNHVLNYTIFYILEKLTKSAKSGRDSAMKNGCLDHVLPPLLSHIVDQIYGMQAAEKQSVDQNLIPTINLESKKRKGLDLLAILCKYISIDKIQYLVKYFEKFVQEYMNSQVNLMKYEEMINCVIFSGFGHNAQIIDTESKQNLSVFVSMLYHSIQNLKGHIKIYKFDKETMHDSTVKQHQKQTIKKSGLKQAYQLQEEVGRNGSIFKKQAKILQQRRNHEIMINCFMQFYLGLIALLIKKKVINAQGLKNANAEINEQFSSMVNFIIECLDHRDNRLLNKCLKIIHHIINWPLQGKAQVSSLTLSGPQTPSSNLLAKTHKKICRKLFTILQKLTNTDIQLLKQCFTLLNDVFSQIAINSKQTLGTILMIIKLHIDTSDTTGSQAIEQPYRLLKTVIYKISGTQLVFEQSVKQIYEFIKIMMINTSLQDIRSVCRLICLAYIRQKDIQKMGNKYYQLTINFKQEVVFYLNNLDCKYTESQLCVLDILEEGISCRVGVKNKELQEIGQVIVMALGTAYANQSTNTYKMQKIVLMILNNIDKSKTLNLLEKALTWSGNTDNKLISICGYFILSNILKTLYDSNSKKNKGLSSQHLAKLLKNIDKILELQLQGVEIYNQNIKANKQQKQTVKNHPQWAQIIHQKGDQAEKYIQVSKNLSICLDVFSQILFNTKDQMAKQNKNITIEIIKKLWLLCGCKSQTILQLTSKILLKMQNLSVFIGNQLISLNRDDNGSFKNKVLQFVTNFEYADNHQVIIQIVNKILTEISSAQEFYEVMNEIILLLLKKLGKSILNLKKFEQSMLMCLEVVKIMMNLNEQSRSKLLQNRENNLVKQQLLRNIAKITRNQLIPTHIKESNQELSEIVKQEISEAQFYRITSNIEAERKQKKTQQKVHMAKLAVTDQQGYEHAKARKKHKKR